MKIKKLIALIMGFGLLSSPALQAQTAVKSTSQKGINWYSLEHAQKLAPKNGKKVLIFAEASWCSYCRKMEQQVFSKTDIQQTMNEYFYPVRVDIESGQKLVFNGKEMTQQEFSRQMRVSGTPTFFFLDKEGAVIGAQPGFIPRDVYKSLLTYVGTDSYNDMTFQEFMNKD